MKPNNYKVLANLSLREFVQQMGIDSFARQIRGKKKKPNTNRKDHWVHLIKTGLLTCPASGKVVDHCRYEYHIKGHSFHYNFYSKCGEPMTIDHKLPKSLGGQDISSNVQPMTSYENRKKGSQKIYM